MEPIRPIVFILTVLAMIPSCATAGQSAELEPTDVETDGERGDRSSGAVPSELLGSFLNGPMSLSLNANGTYLSANSDSGPAERGRVVVTERRDADAGVYFETYVIWTIRFVPNRGSSRSYVAVAEDGGFRLVDIDANVLTYRRGAARCAGDSDCRASGHLICNVTSSGLGRCLDD